MNAYKTRSIVTEDGSIILNGLPFTIGKSVEVIVLDDVAITQPDERWKSLQGSVTRYDDPFEPAIPLEDWDVLQ